MSEVSSWEGGLAAVGLIDELKEAILTGDLARAPELSERALRDGMSPLAIMELACTPAMLRVGERFKKGEIYVPEMLVSAMTVKGVLKVLEPALQSAPALFAASIVLGTVKGDLHDIGKNIVGFMLEGAGIKVIDLDVDVSPQAFVNAIRTHRPTFLGMSALLTTTMPHMQETIRLLAEAGLREDVRVIVGGAPVTEEYAQRIGADLYAPDAARAVEMLRALVS
jgi:5-methyltetrahydrofolate--homocysteine methyltransferase